MAHIQQRDFFERMRQKYPDAFKNVRVLEVGSLDINGTVRDFFNAESYMGCDVGPGPGVDLVCAGEELEFADDYFDVAVSAECFEHNEMWEETFLNMHRMASDYVFVTCASTGRPVHGTHDNHPGSSPFTLDYYSNLTEDDFREAFDLDEMFTEYGFEYNPQAKDLYFWGVK